MTPSHQKNSYQAYNRASHTVAKTRQVVMLYDGVVRNLQQALEAMKENRIEDRYNRLVRASEIITGLQMSLDFESGEQAAQVLYDFYASVDSRIMGLHRSNNAEVCEILIKEIKDMRELWQQIDEGTIDNQEEIAKTQVEQATNGASPLPQTELEALEAAADAISGTAEASDDSSASLANLSA